MISNSLAAQTPDPSSQNNMATAQPSSQPQPEVSEQQPTPQPSMIPKMEADPYKNDPRATPEYWNERIQVPKSLMFLGRIAPRQVLSVAANSFYDEYIEAYLKRTGRSPDFFPPDMRKTYMNRVMKQYNEASEEQRSVDADPGKIMVRLYKTIDQLRREVEQRKLAEYQQKVAEGKAPPISLQQRIEMQKKIDARSAQLNRAESQVNLEQTNVMSYMLSTPVFMAVMIVLVGLIGYLVWELVR